MSGPLFYCRRWNRLCHVCLWCCFQALFAFSVYNAFHYACTAIPKATYYTNLWWPWSWLQTCPPFGRKFLFISYPTAEWRSGKAHIGTDTYCAFDFKINEKQRNMSLSDQFCLGHTHQSLISQDKLLQREDFHVHRRNAEILSILYILSVFPLLSLSRPLRVLNLCLEKGVINIKALRKFLRIIWDFFLFGSSCLNFFLFLLFLAQSYPSSSKLCIFSLSK